MSASITNARHNVYFVQNPGNGLVKIGYSGDLSRRVLAISNGLGCAVRVLRQLPGGPRTEKWLHRKFADLRVRGEWFRFDEAMMSVVPPDEVPCVPVVISHRDIRLSLRERVTAAGTRGVEIGLTKKQVLLTLVGQLTEEEAQFALDALLKGGAQ